MLVYGDAVRRADPRAMLDGIAAAWRRAEGAEGILAHAELAAALIEAGALLQGVADAEWAARGHDDASPLQEGITALLMVAARALARSWESGFAASPLPWDAVHAATMLPLPEAVDAKRPEGYAFYALYPEGHFAAAAEAPDPGARVVGLRSIGTSLAAMVAVGLRAIAPPVTLRPTGHPFARELRLSAAPAADLAMAGSVAIVDEGPGLSGSSLGAVADMLEDHGVAPERIRFFPGHAGDLGPEASARHRRRWAGAERRVVPFERLVLGAERPEHRLDTWVRDLTGPLLAPLDDVSGGRWRQHRYADERNWPPAQVATERLKFLARSERGTFLVKFAGLGAEGAAKLDRARALHAAGFVPEPLGFRHGFLVERWLEAAPVDPRGPDRAGLIDMVGRYLGARARLFPAAPDAGAPLGTLLDMARRNTGLALGKRAADALDPFQPRFARLEKAVRRVETDSRLQPWEWLRLSDGRLLKADALDHARGHDLVGCQDIAWDVAGAAVELALSKAERERVARLVADGSGYVVDPGLVAFLIPCYLAFQIGAFTLAAEALAGWREERARLLAAVEGYTGRLRAVLAAGPEEAA